MKKIGLVTYYKSYNYGVWLQAYATLKFLLLNGFDAEIIAYSNPYEESKLKYSYKEGGRNIGYISSFLKSLLYGKVRYYNKGFQNHLCDYYKLTDKRYSSIEQMKDLEYDVLIVGSDQVWNPVITNGLDKVFLLDFGKADKRISVASSLGSKALSEGDRHELVEALKKFDAISVRENFTKDYLQDSVNKDIQVISDPTFLLTKEDWEKEIASKSAYFRTKEKYILTYFVSKDKKSKKCIDMVKSYSKKLNLPVWAVQFSSYYSSAVDKKILGGSISDFIALMVNAELIITDSFHGTALSLNLGKNFVSCQNTENPLRTYNLLEKVNLVSRINMRCEDYDAVNYEKVDLRIEEMRRMSQNWILRKLE